MYFIISDFGHGSRDSPPKPPAYQANKQASKQGLDDLLAWEK